MSVRRVKRRDRNGPASEYLMIDVFVEHPDGKRERIRKVAPLQNRRAAERYERELRRDLLMGVRTNKKEEVTNKKETPTFAAFAKRFEATYVKTNNKPSEAATKEAILRLHLVPAFGRLKVDAIGVKEIESYKAKKLEEKLAPKTVNNHLTVLRRTLAVAVEWGELGVVPQVKWLKAPEPEFDFLDFEEAERLVAAADPDWRPMIVVGLKGGLRQGELLALRWEDVDLVAGRLMVRRAVSRGVITTPKSGKPREIPLGETVLRALKAHRHLRGELVFPGVGGGLLTKGECKWPLWRACKLGGLRLVGWHVLRHSFASHLVMRGVPIKAVQELLGHASIEMTMRYAHLSPDVRRDAVRTLDRNATSNGNLMATYAANGEN
jgi:integrase